MTFGDKVICVYNDVDNLYDDSTGIYKLELNKIYTIKDTYHDIRDDLHFYVFLEEVGHKFSFNNRRFITLLELRKRKIECLKKVTK